MKIQSVGIAFITLICITAAFAEETAPAQAPVTNLAPSLYQLSLGGAHIDSSGNIRFYERYVTPPDGIYPAEVGVTYLASDGSSAADVHLRNLGEDSAGGDVWLSLANGGVFLQGEQRRSRFFRDWGDGEASTVRGDGTYDMILPTQGGALNFSFRDVSLDSLSGDEDDNWRVTYPAFGIAGLVGGWQTAFETGRERFEFDSESLLSGHTNVFSLRLAPPTSERTAIEAEASVFQTSLDALIGKPRDYRFGITGSHLLTPDLTLHGDVTYNSVHDAIARSAYANRDAGAQVSADYHGLRNTALSVGGGVNRVGYVNGPQTELIKADENNFFAKGTVRLAKNVKLKASHSRWWTNNRPPVVPVLGEPDGSLVWSNKDDQRAELSYTPVANAGITASWRKLNWENDDFATDSAMRERGLFGWWMPRDDLTLYASLLKQGFDLNGSFVSSPYLTDADTTMFGVTYQLTPALSFDTAYTRVNTDGAERARQRGLSLGMAYRWESGMELGLQAVFDDFEGSEGALPLDYTGDWYQLRLSKAIF